MHRKTLQESTMPSLSFLTLALVLTSSFILHPSSFAQTPLPGTKPLTAQGDLAAQMVAGIRRFYLRETERVAGERNGKWRQITDPRQRLMDMIGVVNEPGPSHAGVIPTVNHHTPLPFPREPQPHATPSETKPWVMELTHFDGGKPPFRVFDARWPVFESVEGEGLILVPKGKPIALVIAIPDCDNTPEQLAGLLPGLPPAQQIARRLVERGCKVIVPALIDRKDDHSGRADIRFTNQPHREFLWRAAYEVGRTPIGYEVQKILDAESLRNMPDSLPRVPFGILGYGEGGLIALYASAISSGYDATAVSGYFGPRE
jgi:hypothetical protein